MTDWELHKYTRVYKTLGNLTRAYIDRVGNNWFVYANSSKFKRNVNTHVFTDKREALSTKNAINK